MTPKIDPTRAAVASIVVGLLLCSAMTARAADYQQLYAQGVMAIRKQAWADAQRFIAAAIAANPNEDRRTVYINHSDEPPYVPHYYLGLALLKLGDCKGAVREWQISESQNVVQRTAEYKALVRDRKLCPDEPSVDPAVLAQAVQKAVSGVETAEKLLADLKRESSDPIASSAWANSAALRDGATAAERQLADLRATVDKARAGSNVDDLERAAGAAAKIAQVLKSTQSQLQGAVRQEADKVAERELVARLRNELKTKAARGADLVKALRAAKLDPNGQSVLDRLARTVAVTDQSAGSATRVDLAKWSNDLDDLVRSASVLLKQPPPPRTPEELVAAAKAFFAGNYKKTLADLQNTEQFTGRAKSEALLLRAASTYALYAMTNDPKLRNAAAEQVRSCRGVQDVPVPSSQYFSPRFVDFYASVK